MIGYHLEPRYIYRSVLWSCLTTDGALTPHNSECLTSFAYRFWWLVVCHSGSLGPLTFPWGYHCLGCHVCQVWLTISPESVPSSLKWLISSSKARWELLLSNTMAGSWTFALISKCIGAITVGGTTQEWSPQQLFHFQLSSGHPFESGKYTHLANEHYLWSGYFSCVYVSVILSVFSLAFHTAVGYPMALVLFQWRKLLALMVINVVSNVWSVGKIWSLNVEVYVCRFIKVLLQIYVSSSASLTVLSTHT